MKSSRTNYYSGFDPRSILGCQLWLDATDSKSFTFSSGSNIATWNDKSGNALSGTATGSPVLTTVDGLAAVTFNGTTQYFNFGDVADLGSNQLNIFVVSKFNTTANGSLIAKSLAGDATFRYALIRDAGNMIPLLQGNTTGIGSANNAGFADTNTSTRLLAWSWNRSANQIFQNGTSVFSNTFTNSSTFNSAYSLLVGAYNNNSGGVPPAAGYFLNGSINEILVYFSTLTTIQRQQIEGYLAWKWGLQIINRFSPTSISGCQLWLDAADSSTITTSGTTITAIQDKSGTNKTVTPSNTVSYTPGDAIVFTNNSNAVLGVSGMPAAPYDILTVATANSSTNIFRTLLRTANAPGTHPILLNINTNNLGMWNGTAFNQFGSLTMTANEKALIYATMASNRTMQASKNGAVSLTSSTTAGNESIITSIGNAGAGGQPWGTLQELIIYNTTLTLSERQQVETYLAEKWGLRGLPASHPFKTIPPVLRPFTPVDLEGCALWFDAADKTTITGTTQVTAWVNKGSIAVTASNRTGSCTSGNTLANGLNYIRCPAGTDLGFTTALNTQARSWFVVARNLTQLNVSPQNFWGIINQLGVSGQDAVVFTRAGTSDYRGFIGPAGVAVTVEGQFATNPLNVINIYSFVNSTTSNSNVMTLNGNSQTLTLSSGASGYNTSNLTYTIATERYNTGSDIFEILFYTRDLTPRERQQVEGYLARKWELQTSVVSGHPYRFGLPALTVGFTPVAIPDCVIWLDGADRKTMIFSGSNITQWNTKSGTATFSRISGSAGPILSNGGVYFTGSNSGLYNGSNVQTTQAATFIWVSAYTADGTSPTPRTEIDHRKNTNGTPLRTLYSDTWQIRDPAGSLQTSSAYSLATNTRRIKVWRDTLNLGQGYLNSTLNYSATGSYNQATTDGYGIQLGQHYQNVGGAIFTLFEFIVINRYITDVERELTEGYLAWKWGLQGSLPARHPYRLIRP